MLTIDFIKSVEELGFITNKSYDSVRKVINVSKGHDSSGSGKVAVISVENPYEVSMRWIAYSTLEFERKENLYKIIKEYIETPVDERGAIKAFSKEDWDLIKS